MTESMIHVSTEHATTYVTLTRPQAGNALDRAGVADLSAALRTIGDDVQCVVIRGEGGRAFCGGADSREMVSLDGPQRSAALQELMDCCEQLRALPQVTLAMINGYSSGGGSHLAMACDLRYMTENAWIHFQSARYGLNLTTTWLGGEVGFARALELMATARKLRVDEAVALGVAHGRIEAADIREVFDETALFQMDLRVLKQELLAAGRNDGGTLAAETRRAVHRIGRQHYVDTIGLEPSVRGRQAQ